MFPIAEKVKRIYNTCPACEGIGRVNLKDNQTYQCPNCGGSGKIRSRKEMVWSLKYPLFGINVVSEITVTVTEKGTTEEYLVGGTRYEANDLFATESMALEECKRRNGEVQ